MTSAQFKLDTFEGPLDLLLHLITKHKLNIYDIEIALLLEQYMDYINNLDHEDYEDAADFLEMAARLIYIKTCSLLPQDEEAQELKKELEGRIIEYSLCKKAAVKLREIYIGGDVFVRAPAKVPVNKTYTREHEPIVLFNAYMGLSEKTRDTKPLKADMFEPIVSHKIVSVTSKIIFVLKKLYNGGEFDMSRLYDGMQSKSEKVATFLAVLELTKSGRIFLNDDNSKMFFNEKSRHKKIKSDFDEQTENENISQFSDNDEIEDDAVPFDEIESAASQYEDDDEVVRIPYKPVHKSVNERVRTAECSVIIKDIPIEEPKAETVQAEIISDETTEQTEEVIEIADEIQADEIEKETEEIISENIFEPIEKPAEIGIVPQEESVEAEKNIEDEFPQEPISPEIMAELIALSKLSADPPQTVFKPNYWSNGVYYWGNSPVGDDKQGNFWKYGYKRVRK